MACGLGFRTHRDHRYPDNDDRAAEHIHVDVASNDDLAPAEHIHFNFASDNDVAPDDLYHVIEYHDDHPTNDDVDHLRRRKPREVVGMRSCNSREPGQPSAACGPAIM